MSIKKPKDDRRCTSVTLAGAKCRAKPVKGKQACLFHEASLANVRIAASKRGGEHNRLAVLDATAPDVSFDNAGEVRRSLADTASQVRRGQIDHKIAYAIANLATIALKVLETEELERRITALEVTEPSGSGEEQA